jgi:hypothetical protein
MNYDSYYSQTNGRSYSDYPGTNKGMAYFIYSIVYFLINFGLFFILNTSIEVKIVRRMHTELKEKRERIAKMSASSTTSSVVSTETATVSQADEDRKKAEDEDSKKERKVIKMVVINGILNFILRAPDILFWMENKIISRNQMPRGERPRTLAVVVY